MEKRRFGNTDMDVTVLGFGGAEIGYEGASQETVTELLNSALDAGLNVIDTAVGYVNSEEMIGKAVAGRRKDFFLFSKCGRGGSTDPAIWAKDALLQDIQTSLRELQTDYLDLIQLHSTPLDILKTGEAIEALREARDRGYTRYIGYSGDGETAAYAVETGAFDALQTSISIADQQVLELALPKARARNMGVIAKRPIANAAWRTGKKPAEPYHHAYWDRLQELRYDFLKDDLNDSVALALRFTLSQPGVHTAIVGTKNPARWRENAELLKAGPLPQAQIDAIRTRWNEVADETWVGQV
ncbi:MAG: aldo/keto reductase [FCB group bacterium]|jgi:aryl-alcohol dehydrogenase-like predicted oxidoreductase|nr:aldo/keto reductase [FCB group bacterium]